MFSFRVCVAADLSDACRNGAIGNMPGQHVPVDQTLFTGRP